MKLLEVPEFATLSNEWTGMHSDCRLICNLQAYSCKKTGEEKKQYKQLAEEGGMDELEMLAPPGVASAVVGTAGQEEEQAYCSKKTLYFLNSTLNACYSPDYDFSQAKGTEFAAVPSVEAVTQRVSAMLSPVLGSSYTQRSSELWSTLDSLINLSECEVYLYCGDSQDDPFTEEGTTWSFAYIFYNKKLKRTVLFTAVCLSFSAPLHEQENQDDLPEEFMFQESTAECSDMPEEDEVRRGWAE